MREIKFRVWDNKNRNWVSSSYIIVNSFGRLCCCYSDKTFGEWAIKYDLMQYTELKDCNGKEIYEGDIVCLFDSVREVVCVLGAFGYYIDKYSGFVSFAGNPNIVWINGKSAHNQIEVIGNIYENPELIE